MYMENSAANERELLIFGRAYDPENYKYGGINRFEFMDPATAKDLIRRGFLDPEETQNWSPTAKEFVDFCHDYGSGWTLHGYVVSPERADCRVTIEGISCDRDLDRQEIVDFVEMFRGADEFSVDHGAYCWYD